MKGNYFGAYENSDENAKQGYTLFISKSENVHDYCECAGYVHGKICYHLKEAKKLEKKLSGFDILSVLAKANEERKNKKEDKI